MANQDTLTITRPDPSGAYTQIESGWDPTYADGGATWRPAASWSIAVADTGVISVTETKEASGTGWSEGNPDTYQIQNVNGATVATDFVSIVVSGNSGTAGNGTFTLSDSEIASISASGLITFAAGEGVFITGSTMIITYNANIDEPVTYSYSPALSVKGKKHLTLYHPAQADTETKCKYQWTDGESIMIDGVEQSVWQDVAAVSATADTIVLDSSVNADWAKLDKMAYVRIAVEITDDDVDGFADANTYDHPSTGCYVKVLDDDRTAESNTGVTISGIGADPS